MKQKMSYQQTLKQTFKLNQKMINSLDFLKVDNVEINQMTDEALQTNPFLETKTLPVEHDYNYLENISHKITLQEELYHQLYGCKESYDEEIISYIIESLNDKGFLSYPKETYFEELNISKEIFERNLKIIQSFEPVGVGAQDTIDSICIQLKKANKIKAYKLMKLYKNVILTQNYNLIEKRTRLTKKEIDELFKDIKQCDPFPCSQYFSFENYIYPDINITIENNEIIITPINQPDLIVNDSLYQVVKNDEQMKKYFQEAHFLIENLTKRNKTILMIANELVAIQEGYFKYQDELIACTLSDLEARCGFHKSTISRTLNNKYYSFHNEIFPLKNLLVSKTNSGDSSDSIKKALVLLISNENKNKPLSDEALVKKLEELDLHCSRRVITKYRQQLSIPSSSKRKIKN